MLNAGRKYLGLDDLSGKVFLTSGLGGMSGAQAKAATICGCVGIVAEVYTVQLPGHVAQKKEEFCPSLIVCRSVTTR